MTALTYRVEGNKMYQDPLLGGKHTDFGTKETERRLKVLPKTLHTGKLEGNTGDKRLETFHKGKNSGRFVCTLHAKRCFLIAYHF